MEEKNFMQLAHDFTIGEIYAKFPTSRMKAIVALHFELGYNQELVAQMFHVTQEQIHWEIDMIRKLLLGQSDRSKTGKPYQPRLPKGERRVQIADIIQLAMLLSKQ